MGGRIDGRVAVITGGASGMGKATVLRFCAEGAKVVVGDYNEASGKQLLTDVDEAGFDGSVQFVRTDVAQEADVEAMIATATDAFGGLDIVFNNAGVGGAFGPITEIDVEDWDYTFGVMCRGVFLGIKHAARVMKAQGRGGSIINTASVAGLSGGAGPQAYSAAKAAVINLTRSAAMELAVQRIRVNAICPGGINTPLINFGNEENMGARLAELQPWPDYGRGEHIAGAALFLASDDAEFVTGEALVVDGGLTAAGPRLWQRLGTDFSSMGFSGVSRGTTGEPPVMRGQSGQ